MHGNITAYMHVLFIPTNASAISAFVVHEYPVSHEISIVTANIHKLFEFLILFINYISFSFGVQESSYFLEVWLLIMFVIASFHALISEFSMVNSKLM